MKQNLEISKEGYLNLINKVYQNKLEEREFALDRYRKADMQIETTEHFVLMGKNAVAYLNQASVCTNDLALLAKEIKSIVYKEEESSSVPEELSDEWKDAIQDSVKDLERGVLSKKILDKNIEED